MDQPGTIAKEIRLNPLTDKEVTPDYVSWLNNPEIRRYLGIRHRREPLKQEDVIRFLEDCESKKRHHWGIYYQGRHIGNVSCSAWSRENRWIDISYLIGDRNVQGRGIATLAVGAAMRYLFERREYHRVQAGAIVENRASIRVMEKLRMRKDAQLRGNAYLPAENRFADEVIYSALKEEWIPPFAEINDIPVLPMRWEKTNTKKESRCKN
ncbi:MAG: GNAT family N-acetyltransferase [Deltaproteobacteria bacterium]|nr:GNAT family N-acetyltransferase [Deltaproteobacteria bacterium]